MPNISFDIFFDQDFLNVTATRSQGAPKAKPAWKVRTAPKLAPKEQPEPPQGSAPNRPQLKKIGAAARKAGSEGPPKVQTIPNTPKGEKSQGGPKPKDLSKKLDKVKEAADESADKSKKVTPPPKKDAPKIDK